jgi:GNAT superfamily N-acetyltransferase
MTVDDLAPALELGRKCGWNQTEADWRLLLPSPSVFCVARREGRLLGTAGAVCYGQDLAWICMVLVDEAERGHGIGTRLVAEVLERLSGFAAIGLDATPQGRPIYARLGFGDGYALARFQAEPSPGLPPAPSARPLRDADLPSLLDWDREVFGADRAAVLRFARAEAPEYAFCIERGGRIDGYCLGRHGQVAEHLGPVVARTSAVAHELAAAVRTRNRERRFFVDATLQPEWLTSLLALGFRQQRTFTRMYRGPAPQKPPGALYAILGPEFG